MSVVHELSVEVASGMDTDGCPAVALIIGGDTCFMTPEDAFELANVLAARARVVALMAVRLRPKDIH